MIIILGRGLHSLSASSGTNLPVLMAWVSSQTIGPSNLQTIDTQSVSQSVNQPYTIYSDIRQKTVKVPWTNAQLSQLIDKCIWKRT